MESLASCALRMQIAAENRTAAEFFCDVFVGEPLEPLGEKEAFLAALKSRFESLRAEGTFPEWE